MFGKREGAIRAIIVVAFISVTTVVSHAAGNAERGKEIADRWCAECHQTTAGAIRIDQSKPATFQEIADAPGMSERALKAFFRTPHNQMPNFSITDETRDHLISYITNLRRK
jgi:mono/diheme cytochrome c family protein